MRIRCGIDAARRFGRKEIGERSDGVPADAERATFAGNAVRVYGLEQT